MARVPALTTLFSALAAGDLRRARAGRRHGHIGLFDRALIGVALHPQARVGVGIRQRHARFAASATVLTY